MLEDVKNVKHDKKCQKYIKNVKRCQKQGLKKCLASWERRFPRATFLANQLYLNHFLLPRSTPTLVTARLR